MIPCSDREIFEQIMQGEYEDTFMLDRVELLLRAHKNFSLYSQRDCCSYLGDKFRVVLVPPEDWTDEQVGNYLLKKICLVHLAQNRDKFNLLM